MSFASNFLLKITHTHTHLCAEIYIYIYIWYIPTSASSKEWHNDVHQNQPTLESIAAGPSSGRSGDSPPANMLGGIPGWFPTWEVINECPPLKKGLCWRKEIYISSIIFFRGYIGQIPKLYLYVYRLSEENVQKSRNLVTESYDVNGSSWVALLIFYILIYHEVQH